MEMIDTEKNTQLQEMLLKIDEERREFYAAEVEALYHNTVSLHRNEIKAESEADPENDIVITIENKYMENLTIHVHFYKKEDFVKYHSTADGYFLDGKSLVLWESYYYESDEDDWFWSEQQVKYNVFEGI